MAARSTSARRLRWLVLVGLAGAAVWVVRSRRAGSAGLLEQWPETSSVRPPSPPVLESVPEPVPAAVSAPPEPEPELVRRPVAPPADESTPPLGVPVPTVAAGAAPDATGTAEKPISQPTPAATATDLGRTTEPTLAEPASGELVSADPVPGELTPGEPASAEPTSAEPDPAEPAPAEPLTGSNPRFSPSGQNGAAPATVPSAARPAAPSAVRPSPSPRPRSTTGAQLIVGSGAAPARPDGSAPGPEYTIKGNTGSMLFHRPDSPHYTRTRAEAWFRTATDARAAGFTEYPRNRAEDS